MRFHFSNSVQSLPSSVATNQDGMNDYYRYDSRSSSSYNASATSMASSLTARRLPSHLRPENTTQAMTNGGNFFSVVTFLSSWLGLFGHASSCSSLKTHTVPVLTRGYHAQLVAQNLNTPRGMVFDEQDRLLVIEPNFGIKAMKFKDDGPLCLKLEYVQTVVNDSSLNHGIDILGIPDPENQYFRTLVASSNSDVKAWRYDLRTAKVDLSHSIISGMANGGHSTRTLLFSHKYPGMLMVSRGSDGNLDPQCRDVNSGHCQIRVFGPVDRRTPTLTFSKSGNVLGMGLRNSVGIAEHPVTGAVWSVENSVDNFGRDGEDVHQNNPGEELNLHKRANALVTKGTETNYGYPDCFAAWDIDILPNNTNARSGRLTVGTQIANLSRNDNMCSQYQPPELTLPPHMAPLDLKFTKNGTAAYVTLHGSWNRDNPKDPVGYMVAKINFNNNTGKPSQPSTSQNALEPILYNHDVSKCPDGCIRPVAMAWDSKGRLFVSSDQSREIYVITKDDGSSLYG